MNATVKSLGIDRLGLDERLQLVEEIWDLIGEKDENIPLTAEQRAELELRLTEDEARPDATVAWSDIEASALASLKR